jgi:hypothetical protein
MWRFATHRQRTNPLHLGAAVAVLFTLLYLALPTREYYWDGVAFSIMIETTRDWHKFFSVHHLLYDFVGDLAYRLTGGHIRVLYLFQWINCIAGGILLWLAHQLFRRCGVPGPNCTACVAIVGFSATFWKFTTDADSYILANVFLVATYLALRRSLVGGSLLQVCAMMMHQLSALFYPVGLALIWRRSREHFWRDAAIYTLITAGGTLAIYTAAFHLSTARETPTFLDWVMFHRDISQVDLPFNFNVADDARWLLLGTGKLLVGGKITRTAYFFGPVALTLAGLGLAGLIRARRQLLAVDSAWPLLIWLSVYMAFLLAWEPHNTFYRLFYLIPLVALLAATTRRTDALPLTCIAAALLCWNFPQFIYPKTRVENNPPLAVAMEQQKRWPGGTGVIFARFVPDLWTISYFNPQVSWIGIDRPDSAQVAARVTEFERDGRKLYVDWTYLQLAGHPVPRFTFQSLAEPDSDRQRRRVPIP